MNFFQITLVILFLYHRSTAKAETGIEEVRAKLFLKKLNMEQETLSHRSAVAQWAHATNITKESSLHQLDVSAEVAKKRKENWQKVIKFNWQTFSDVNVKRQFKKYSILGKDILRETDLIRLNSLVSEMTKIYSTAKVCAYNNATKCDLSLEPELNQIMGRSRNPEHLKHAWVEWRKAVGHRCRWRFKLYVKWANEAARLNNYTDNGEYWLRNYEDPEFKSVVNKLWQQLRPLYLQLHAYVRFKLRQKYGNVVSEKGPIPAHLLGNMWAQQWRNILDLTLPYPKKKYDLERQMKKQNYTVKSIFKTAEEFFTSINLPAMPKSFWERSLLEKPRDRAVVCHPSAWNFYNGDDFRIKQCTKPNLQFFSTTHHEMGHVQYYLQYKNQPVIFRSGANPGFHEAVGDLILLSVQSRKHLRKIGLLKTKTDHPENILNNLFEVALDKIAFLPYGYLIDLYRWDIFRGAISPNDYNCKWWELREKYQGLEPPVVRNEDDFDPAAKYHIIADVPYIRYFVSAVLQFQFHKAVCEKAGEYDPEDPSKPLHECDIYQNAAAGNAIKKMLQLGSSKPWPDALEVLTGQRSMDASALLEYFKPLHEWLKAENKKNGAIIGWKKSTKRCIPALVLPRLKPHRNKLTTLNL